MIVQDIGLTKTALRRETEKPFWRYQLQRGAQERPQKQI